MLWGHVQQPYPPQPRQTARHEPFGSSTASTELVALNYATFKVAADLGSTRYYRTALLAISLLVVPCCWVLGDDWEHTEYTWRLYELVVRLLFTPTTATVVLFLTCFVAFQTESSPIWRVVVFLAQSVEQTLLQLLF